MNTKDITARLKTSRDVYLERGKTYTYYDPGYDQKILVIYIGEFNFIDAKVSGTYHMFENDEGVPSSAFLVKEEELEGTIS